MSVIFKPENHKYESLDPNEKIEWLSVTKFVSQFKQPFDPVAQSEKASKNPKSKWYGLSPAEIRAHWEKTTEEAINRGSLYHNQREEDLTSLDTIQRSGKDIPIIKPIFNNGIKHAPEQRLVEGIYPEHFVYLKSASLCGQSDMVEIIKDIINITDYKTNKEIKKTGFTNWEGITQKMIGPCAHLDDCNFNHYALQLSTYMYIIQKHNPRYRPGKMFLHHVIFELEGHDKFGNPIPKKDSKDEAIVKEVIPYEVPYLKSEVISMINHIKDKRK